ncbi:putative holin-like toxin [Acetivibrio ethanolgignens]
MITYSDLIQFCIFIVALAGLCYQVFKDKEK